MEISEFKYKIIEEVKFHEVDLMGVVNNAVYFSYFEDGRIKYLQNLKTTYKLKEILEGNSFFIMAHNYCNYLEPGKFDEVLNIYTKIDTIKNTSFTIKHIVENNSNKKIIAEGGGVMVHIDFCSKQKMPLPQEFYDAVQDFEKDVIIVEQSS